MSNSNICWTIKASAWNSASRRLVEADLADAQRQEAVKQAGIAKAQRQIASEEKVRAENGEQAARRRFYAAQMNLAGQAAAQGHLGRVLELLESQRPRFDEEELRSFEWYHLGSVLICGASVPDACAGETPTPQIRTLPSPVAGLLPRADPLQFTH